jgi:23S rRNA (guanosine2251-2'-O)-methyltransferase
MVERSKWGKGKHKRGKTLLGSHARCWIWGRNLVCETLRARRWPFVELYLADNLPADQLEEARGAASDRGVNVRIARPEVLEQLGHTSEHQGFLAKMGPFPYTPIEEIWSAASPKPVYLVLDAVQDPYNFGAMLRSAGAFAADGVFIGKHRQVPVTSMVARSSAGVVNCVPIVQVADLADLAQTLRRRNIKVIGASEKADAALTDCDFCDATAIVIGNEGSGIGPELLKCCDGLARIPIAGSVGSLNAAAAAAVFFFEVRRQRGQLAKNPPA